MQSEGRSHLVPFYEMNNLFEINFPPFLLFHHWFLLRFRAAGSTCMFSTCLNSFQLRWPPIGSSPVNSESRRGWKVRSVCQLHCRLYCIWLSRIRNIDRYWMTVQVDLSHQIYYCSSLVVYYGLRTIPFLVVPNCINLYHVVL